MKFVIKNHTSGKSVDYLIIKDNDIFSWTQEENR